MRVAVLRGGVSPDYHPSLESGAEVIKHLRDDHDLIDVYIDREGRWHKKGVPVEPARLVPHADIFVNALHGEYGEDGQVQRVLEKLGAKYTGPGPLEASFAINKVITKAILSDSGLMVPAGLLVTTLDEPYETADYIWREIMGGQFIVKPIDQGFTRGVELVRTHNELPEAIIRGLLHWKKVLVEERLHGKEIQVSIINNLRGSELYHTLPLNALTGKPIVLSNGEKEQVIEAAREAHRSLGLKSYSSVDIILNLRGPVVLEVDSLPALTPKSHFVKSLANVGVSLREFLNHLVAYATRR